MTVESLKLNLMQERKLIDNILVIYEQYDSASAQEKNFFQNAIYSLINQIDLINNSVPRILEEIKTSKELPMIVQREPDVRTAIIGQITLDKKDQMKYMKELQITKRALIEIKKKTKEEKVKEIEVFKKPNQIAAAASKMFGKFSSNLTKQGAFRAVNMSLRKANMPYLLSTYLSLTFFFTFVIFAVTLVAAILFSFIKVGYVAGNMFPVFSMNTEDLLLRLLKNLVYPFVLGILTFMCFIVYPLGEASSIKGRVENELPFVILHMSSVAGSGVEPSRIFRIIALSKEYPVIGKEVRKIVNQINLYGYDLITALRNTAKTTSNEKLATLFNGLATNLASGGDLSNFLDKKASDTLLDYKLSRKKYSAMAETSMDLYIGVLIAAPLIFMILLIMINAIGIGVGGMGMGTLSVLIIGGTVLLNIGFLIFLKLRQPAG